MSDSVDKGRPRVSQDVVIAVLLVAIIVTAGWLLLRDRYSWDARVNRAARAVVAGLDEAPGHVTAQGPKGIVTVPARPRFDRLSAVQLALELERLRPAEPPSSADAAAALASTAYVRERIRRFLKTDATGALLVLYGLGWPWMGAEPVLPEEGQPVETPARSPLAEVPAERLEQMTAVAEEAASWPEAEKALQGMHGLGDTALFDVRRRLVRRALEDAFASRAGRERVHDALGKCAALAPVQAETVLAMRGTLALLRGGEEADGALESIGSEHPELAAPIIEARKSRGL
ncbi:MAG: hypothetical protein R6X33_18665 [Candidatus Brocadiia bacterium]